MLVCGVDDSRKRLFADSQTLDHRAVLGYALARDVVQKATTASDQDQETPTAVVVLLVIIEVTIEMVDPMGEQSHLDLGRARVIRVLLEIIDYCCFGFW